MLQRSYCSHEYPFFPAIKVTLMRSDHSTTVLLLLFGNLFNHQVVTSTKLSIKRNNTYY